MIKTIKNLSIVLGVLAVALVVAATPAQAALTLGATAVTTDGALTLTTVATSTVTMFAANTTGTITIGGTAGTGAMKFGESTGIQSISIGTVPAAETVAKTIVIGNANAGSTSTTTIHAGTGGLNLGTTADARTIAIGTGNAIQTINIGTHATPVNVISIGGAASTLTIGATLLGGSPLVFEGATADAFETTLALTDPTADQTWTIPNFAVNAAFLGSTLTTNNVDAANSIWGISNSLVFEGATADAFETTVTLTDPTADRTITFGNATGTVVTASTAITTIKAQLADDASGWVPDGVATDFTITADAASIAATSLVVVSIDQATAAACSVYDLVASTNFKVKCTAAPANAATLSYMIVN